jgi:hypothetical protein
VKLKFVILAVDPILTTICSSTSGLDFRNISL